MKKKNKKVKIDFRMEYEHLPGDVYRNQKRWQPEPKQICCLKNELERNYLKEVVE